MSVEKVAVYRGRVGLGMGIAGAFLAAVLLAAIVGVSRRGDERTLPTTPDGEIAVPSTTPPPASDDAMRVVDGLRGRLAVDDAQASCIAARLDADRSLRDRLAEPGPGPDEDAMKEASMLAGRCIQATTMADQFARNAVRTAGQAGLDQDALACLRDGYASLTPEQLVMINKAASNPSAEAEEAVRRLFERCGLEHPNRR